MRKTTNSRRISLEMLERRSLLAGNITALVDGGSLVLTGDATANGVAIHQADTGKYVVSGFGLDGSATLINGMNSPQVFSNITADLVIDLRDGDDVLVLSNNAAQRQSLADQLSGGTAGTIAASPVATNTNTVSANQVAVPRNLQIQTGADDDGVALNVNVGGASGGYAVVSTGAGADTLLVKTSTFQRNLAFDTGDGADVVGISKTHVHDSLFATLGIGSDKFAMSGSSARAISVNASDGADTVQILTSSSTEETAVSTGGGNDRLTINGLNAANLSVLTGAGDDYVAVSHANLTDAATIGTGDGDDQVSLDFVDADNDLVVLLGNGDDSLRVTNTTAGSASFSGSNGNDVLDLRSPNCSTGTNHFGSAGISGFETILAPQQQHGGGSDGGSDGGRDGGSDGGSDGGHDH